jgi:TolB-like protein
VRRLLAAALVALFGLPLLAAAPNASGIKPSVIVYPLVSTGSSVDREASSRLATLIATQMANTGEVAVIPPPPGTERKDYLSVARSHGADYYVSGFVSPLGNGVSVVLQVVSTASGIVVYSQSSQIATYAEAAGQGDDLASFISRHANRAFAAIPTPPPHASPTPAASSGPEANLGRIFGRRKATPAPKATATPKPGTATAATARPAPAGTAPAAALVNVTATPSPRPAAATPSPRPAAATPSATPASAAETAAPRAVAAAPAATPSGYAVLTVEGTADAALREFATQRLLARTSGERAQSTATACGAHPVRAVLSGNLAVRPDAQFGGGSATFELIASDCAGKVLWRQTHSNDAGGAQGQQLATERAVDAAIGAYLNPPRRRRL